VRRDHWPYHSKPNKSQRHRDTDSHTDKSFKAALPHPSWVSRDAAVYLHFKAQSRHRLSYTHRDAHFHKDKSFTAAWRRPLGERETREPIYYSGSKHNSCRDMKHSIYKASKPKLTPPSQAVEKAADSTFTGIEKAINQSAALKSSKVRRRLVTLSVVLTQKQKIQISIS